MQKLLQAFRKSLTPVNSALVLGILAIVAIMLFANIIIRKPSSSTKVTVTVKVQYQNPFAKETQYQNPFSEYQNPIDDLVFAQTQ